jgi:Fe2+ or Zn2+ uptake regulation protein
VTSDIFTPDADLSSRLRARGQRVTSQRLLIHAALGDLGRHATADEVLSAVSPRLPSVSLPTIYATLELLEDLGLVHRLETGEGTSCYEPAHPSGEHHHHLICNRCGRVSAFEDAGLERSVQKMARRLTFRVEGHDVDLRGTCAACLADADAVATTGA